MIYFIQVKHNGPIKISQSNPWQHCRTQGVGNQFDFIGSIPGNTSFADKIQSDLKAYRLEDLEYRLTHEWYQPVSEVLDYVKNILSLEYEMIEGVPCAVIWRDAEGALTDHCPFCGERHRHRSRDGLCFSHCRFNSIARYANGTLLIPNYCYIIRTRGKDSSATTNPACPDLSGKILKSRES
ncbi:hypothetical protein C6502_01345 [Candidatus Poribacteria bacterium]|nr:MAG: hypothetical protein C6502_01345 [Candidatus Poribacteria bacterium]